MASKDPYPSHHADISPLPIGTQPLPGATDLTGVSHHPPHVPAQPARKVTGKFTVFLGNSMADTSNYTSHPGQTAQTSSSPTAAASKLVFTGAPNTWTDFTPLSPQTQATNYLPVQTSNGTPLGSYTDDVIVLAGP